MGAAVDPRLTSERLDAIFGMAMQIVSHVIKRAAARIIISFSDAPERGSTCFSRPAHANRHLSYRPACA